MTGSLGRSLLANTSTLIALALLIFSLDIGRIDPIPGARMVNAVQHCETQACDRGTPTVLPYYSDSTAGAEIKTEYFRATVTQASGTDTGAIYLPRFSENLDIWVNGTPVFVNTLPQRLWATPMLISIPPGLLADEDLVIDIALHGISSEGLTLQPFFFGPRDVLLQPYAWRYFLGPGLARFAFGLMIVLSVMLLFVGSVRRKEPEYLSLGLACAVVLLPLAHYAYGVSPGDYKLGTILWSHSVLFYVFLHYRFLNNVLGLGPTWPYWVVAAILPISTFLLFLVPAKDIFLASMLMHILTTVPASFLVHAKMFHNRGRFDGLDFLVFSFSHSMAVVLGGYELYLNIVDDPVRTLPLFHIAPLMMIPTCLWLFVSRLVRSLNRFEALNASLNQTIAQKTRDLEESFSKLERIKRREAIAEERDRIMLDLHDGIGGQLVSTLAYMESSKTGDDKIRIALQDALRDLALMLDSMENHESVVTLLGMMRTRHEGLLSEHGIEFDWHVHGEPELSQSGPSQSLHMARIVQEAITNVIKHAKADTITIFVDEREIRISDNGQGFDPDDPARKGRPANGIANMQRRCETIGARFSLSSSPSGTRISLLLDGEAPATG